MPNKKTSGSSKKAHPNTVKTTQNKGDGKSYGQDQKGTSWEYRYGMREGTSVDKKTKKVKNPTGKTDQRIKYARYKKPGMKSWSKWQKVRPKK